MVQKRHDRWWNLTQEWSLPALEFGKAMKRIAAIVLGLVCFGALSGAAGDAQKVNPYSAVLSEATSAELPAKAADLVKRAKARDRSVTTVNVVKAALQANPGSARAVVSVISKAVPEMAPIAAATAAELQPKEAALIAKAAASAAPSRAAKIVVAVSRAVPGSWRDVAAVVGDAVPGSSQAILTALAAAFPELSAAINEALAKYTSELPSVGLILDQVVAVGSSSASTGVRGPTITPPYTSGSGAPGTIIGGNSSTPVPPGGRNYTGP